MNRNKLVIPLLAALSLAALPAISGENISKEMLYFHHSILTIDSHVDIPPNYATDLVDPAKRQRRQVDLPKMQEGGLDAAFFIVFIGQDYRNNWQYDHVQKETLKRFKAIHRMVEQNPDSIEFARTAADVKRINKAGKKVALIGMENGYMIGKDLSLLKTYYDLGARYITLTHFGHNDIGDSSNPMDKFTDQEHEHGGLSNFGREVVREMNRLGIMVDISHTAKATMMQAIELSKAPIIASHSGIREVNDHARNLDDEQLLAIHQNGGVAQVTAVDEFLLNQPAEMWQKIHQIRTEMGLSGYKDIPGLPENVFEAYQDRIEKEVRNKWRWVNIQDFVDHIDHAVKVASINHVGIASDFGGGGGVKGWDNAAETANVTAELLKRGYTKIDIAKLWGGNILRVMADVEEVAKSIQTILNGK